MPEDNRSKYRDVFSDREWDRLTYVPALVFAAVAGADGVIDAREVEAFKVHLVKSLAFESGLISAIMAAELANLETVFDRILKGDIDVVETLDDIIQSVDEKLPPEDARLFKDELMALGRYTAEASGKFLGLFGSSVSKNERRMLDLLHKVLHKNSGA